VEAIRVRANAAHWKQKKQFDAHRRGRMSAENAEESGTKRNVGRRSGREEPLGAMKFPIRDTGER
jgi:hypothetical protein